MRTLEARDGSTRRVSLRQRLTAGVALSVAAASVVIVGTSVPAFASSVSGVTVTPTRAVAGAKTTYTVGFTATTALTINVGTITLTGPGGTLFPLVAADYTVKDGAGAFTAVSVLPTGTAGNVTITTPVGVAASDVVAVVALGVTNPGAGGPLTTSVATSTDTTALPSGNYTITAATAITAVTVPTVSPAKASSTNALYSVHFTAATALVADFDTITLTAPATTVFPLVAADYMVNAGGGTAITEDLTPTQSSPNSVTLNVPPSSVGGGVMLVNASNVTNPSTASATETMTVSTSQDATIGTSTSYAITAATAVTVVTAVPVSTTHLATTTYNVGFNATTALVSTVDTITLTGPVGTIFPAGAGAYTVGVTTVTATPVRSAGNATVTFVTPVAVPIGAATVAVTGVTNPADGTDTLSVSTSADGVLVPSGSYTITSSVGAVSVVTAPTTAGAVAMYTIGSTATTALTAGTGTITVVGQSGTLFPLVAADYTVNGTAVTVLPTGTAGNVTITTPVSVIATGSLTVVAVGVTNPTALSRTLTLATSTDTVATTSGAYIIAAAGPSQVTNATASPSPTTTGSAATYTVTFTATTLVNVGGTITLVGPAGTLFPLIAADYTVKDGAGAVTAVSVLPTGTAGNVTITTPVALTAASVVIVVATSVTNPAVGPRTLTVATSLDTTPLATSFYAITAAGGGGGGGGTTPAAPVRLAGADRFGTAIAASQVEFPTALSAGAVVLARSDDYPDALVGTALATARNAPLLFANGGGLTAGTVTEIQRVLPAGGTVYLLGGLAAIPASVATTLTGLGFVVVRYGGADRFSTALLVADALGDPSTVLLATGINFPDALAAGPAAAHLAGVVLLTNGTVLTAAVQAYLTGHPGKVYAIGGPAVTADPSATPLSGADRYGTAAAVAAALFTAPNNVGVASGTQFPDALSGGAFQGHFGGPIVLTDPGVLPAPTSTYLTGAATTIVATNIFGGTAALSTAVQASISTALGL